MGDLLFASVVAGHDHYQMARLRYGGGSKHGRHDKVRVRYTRDEVVQLAYMTSHNERLRRALGTQISSPASVGYTVLVSTKILFFGLWVSCGMRR